MKIKSKSILHSMMMMPFAALADEDVQCQSETAPPPCDTKSLPQLEQEELVPRTFHLDGLYLNKSIYRQQHRSFEGSPLNSTGFYIHAGQPITLQVDMHETVLTNPLKAFVLVPTDASYQFMDSQRFSLSQGINTFTPTQDGILYLYLDHDHFDENVNIDVKLLDGGDAFPRYVLGKHSQKEWLAMLEQYPNAPYVEFVSHKMVITSKKDIALSGLANLAPQELLEGWDHVVNLAQKQYGTLGMIHRRFHYIDGVDLQGSNSFKGKECAGWMNAWPWRLKSCYNTAMKEFFEPAGENATSSWGPWHELGHHMQMSTFTWSGMTETTVNLTSLYIERAFGIESRLERDKQWDNIVFPYLNKPEPKNFDTDIPEGNTLAMFWQLDLTFGEDFYHYLGHQYRTDPMSYTLAHKVDKQQTFIVRTSQVSGYDLTPFFKKWGLNPTAETSKKLQQLSLKPLTLPIWENRDNYHPHTLPLPDFVRPNHRMVPVQSLATPESISQQLQPLSSIEFSMDEDNHLDSITFPAASSLNKGKEIVAYRSQGSPTTLIMNQQKIDLPRYVTKFYYSTGERWIEWTKQYSELVAFVPREHANAEGIRNIFVNTNKAVVIYTDGYWNSRVDMPDANGLKNKQITISRGSTYSFVIYINGTVKHLNRGESVSFYSDGTQWVEGTLDDNPVNIEFEVTGLGGQYINDGQEVQVTFNLMTNHSGILQASLEKNGDLIYQHEQDLSEGVNSVLLPMSNIANGDYQLHLTVKASDGNLNESKYYPLSLIADNIPDVKHISLGQFNFEQLPDATKSILIATRPNSGGADQEYFQIDIPSDYYARPYRWGKLLFDHINTHSDKYRFGVYNSEKQIYEYQPSNYLNQFYALTENNEATSVSLLISVDQGVYTEVTP